jgi:predicted  nucleic acid-binding Zn-ribbon protein
LRSNLLAHCPRILIDDKKWVFLSHFVYNQPMSASLGLHRLQQVDRQIDHVRSQLNNIRQTLENDAELRESLKHLETTQTDHHRANHALKNAEAEVEAQRIKIEQAESSLYGGKVQNPKELQDLQKDIVSLKKHLSALEERELETMIKVETAENDLQNAKTKLELIQARLGSEHKKLLEDQSKLMIILEQLAEEREATLAPIESNMLQIYEGLRRQKNGVAISEVNDNSCTCCGATITASLQQNARSQKQLANCPSCGRILYAN